MNPYKRAVVIAAGVALCASALHAANVSEAEPNTNKGTATTATLADGDSILGSISPINDVDYFLVTTAPREPGIYRHELSFGVVPGASTTISIRGRTQTTAHVVNLTSDVEFQKAAVTPKVSTLVWYGFGQSESVYVKIGGSILSYTGTLTDHPVEPIIAAGPLYPGTFTFQTTGMASDIWLYKQDPDTHGFGALADAGADAPLNGTGGTVGDLQVQAGFVSPAPLTPGTYLMAIGAFNNTANDLPSPAGDPTNKAVLDFPGAIANNNVAQNSAYGPAHFYATDALGNSVSADLTFAQLNQAEVQFVQFTVLSTPLPMLAGSSTLPSPAMPGQAVTLQAQIAPSPMSTLDNISEVMGDLSALTGDPADTALAFARQGSTDIWSRTAMVAPGVAGTVMVPMSITDPSIPGTSTPMMALEVAAVVPPTGICCRGARCDPSLTEASACNALANARFSTLGSGCNANGEPKTPCCAADFNKDNTVDVGDIFAFLRGWFSADPFADATQDDSVNVSDIFAFLRAWFAGECSTS